MSTFPTLKTGAVLQYPGQKEIRFSTQAVRFIDGSEQRFQLYQTPLHRWMIRLDLLDQGELHQLQEFFRTQSGAAQSFAFTDPWDGTNYPNCNIEEDTMSGTLAAELNAQTSLTVRENRS